MHRLIVYSIFTGYSSRTQKIDGVPEGWTVSLYFFNSNSRDEQLKTSFTKLWQLIFYVVYKEHALSITKRLRLELRASASCGCH